MSSLRTYAINVLGVDFDSLNSDERVQAAVKYQRMCRSCKEGPEVQDIAGFVSEGKLMSAWKAAAFLFPLKTLTMQLGAAGVSFTLYNKLYVPWRHFRLKYDASQLLWRDALGTAVSSPAVKRAYLAFGVCSFITDEVYLRKYARERA